MIVTIFVALGVMLVAGLVVIATMQNVQAQAGCCVTYNKDAGIETSCTKPTHYELDHLISLELGGIQPT